jgi:hypothetical protein
MKGNTLLQGEMIAKEKKYTEIFKKKISKNQPAKFNQTWYKQSFGYGNSISSSKGPGLVQRGDNHKNGVGHLKILFSRTTGPENLNFYMKAF